MTALRQRLIEDMQVRNYSPRTVEAYVAAVAKLANHFHRSPDQLGSEEVRAFQVHLLAAKTSWSQFNQIVCGLRFFYRVTLQQPDMVVMLPYGKRPKRLPVVLGVEEVAQLLEAARPGQERVLLQTAYACGLRLSELLNLQVTDIDSSLRGDGRRFVLQRARRSGGVAFAPLGVVPAWVFPAGACVEPSLSRQVPGRSARVARARQVDAADLAARFSFVHGLAQSAVRQGMGGVCEAAVWRFFMMHTSNIFGKFQGSLIRRG